jgi:hypothetical protein
MLLSLSIIFLFRPYSTHIHFLFTDGWDDYDDEYESVSMSMSMSTPSNNVVTDDGNIDIQSTYDEYSNAVDIETDVVGYGNSALEMDSVDDGKVDDNAVVIDDNFVAALPYGEDLRVV